MNTCTQVCDSVQGQLQTQCSFGSLSSSKWLENKLDRERLQEWRCGSLIKNNSRPKAPRASPSSLADHGVGAVFELHITRNIKIVER